MLGAALSTPRGSGCPWDDRLPQPVAPSAGTALLGLQKQLFPAAKSHVLGFVFFFFCPKREEWHLSAPACGQARTRGAGCWVRCGGALPPTGRRTWPWVPLVTCLRLSPRQLPAAQGPLLLGHGLGMAWERLGHGLGTAWACPVQRCCCGVSGVQGAAVAAQRFLG